MPKGRGKMITARISHHQGKYQYTMAITSVLSESLWMFPDSCTADDGQSEGLSNGSLAQEVHLGNANGYSAVFLQGTFYLLWLHHHHHQS